VKTYIQLLSRTWLLSIFLLGMQAMATESSSASNVSESQSEVKQRAIDTARKKLVHELKLKADELQLVSAESHTWPNSGLGCAPAGSMTAQVMTPGYVVTFTSPKGQRVVHATERYAVVCERNVRLRNPRTVDIPLKNLDEMIDKARSDLAERLRVQASSIRTLRFTPAEWPDTSMGCVMSDEVVEQKSTRGYRIALSHAGRTYIYHTDMSRVRACPPISVD
jgi:hypothetical protein